MAQPWKHPQTGIYYFRRSIPAVLRPALGKREWKVSLRTKELSEARLRFPPESLKCEELFHQASSQLAGRTVLTRSDAPKLADRWARQQTTSWVEDPEQANRFLVWTSDEVRQRACWHPASDLIDDWQDADEQFRRVGVDVTEALAAQGFQMFDRSDPLWLVFINTFFYRWAELCRLAVARHEGDWSSAIDLPHATQKTTPEVATATANSRAKRLLAVYQLWADDRLEVDGQTRASLANVSSTKVTLRQFTELFGDLPVDGITREIVHAYQGKLQKLPSQGKGVRALTAPEAIKRAERDSLPLAGIETTRKKLNQLAKVLAFAKDRLGIIHHEPVSSSGVIARLKSSAVKRDRRAAHYKEYSREQLQQIFSSELFTQGWSPKRADLGKALYWLPLIMAYTGARREEIAQLTVTDVQRDEKTGIYFLSIFPSNDDQSVKNQNSRRNIPLHVDLLALGLIEYRDSLPSAGRLFPKLKMHKKGGYGAHFAQPWSQYLKEVVKLEATASPSHGFRHSFKTICREVSIPREVSDWLTGHADSSEGDTYGSNPLKRMADELEKFPSLAGSAGLLVDK